MGQRKVTHFKQRDCHKWLAKQGLLNIAKRVNFTKGYKYTKLWRPMIAQVLQKIFGKQRYWLISFWYNILCVDNKKKTLWSNYKKFAWRRQSEAFNRKNKVYARKHGTGCIMFYGRFLVEQLGLFVRVDVLVLKENKYKIWFRCEIWN